MSPDEVRMAGLPLEDEEGSSRDDVPFDDAALFEWLFGEARSDVDEAWSDETGGSLGHPGPDGRGSAKSFTPRPALDPLAEHHEGTETAMVERPENQPEEQETPEGEQEEQPDPDAPEPGTPTPDEDSNPGPDSTTGEDGSGALHTGVPQ